MVGDMEELGKLDASEITLEGSMQRKSQRPENVKNHFPIADGAAKLLGRDHDIRESTLRQYQLGE